MPPKKEPRFKPKAKRANNEVRAKRARDERERLAAIAAHAAAVRAEREQEELRMREGEAEEEERIGASAQNPSGTGGFWVGGNERGDEEGARDLAGGSAGHPPQRKWKRQKQNERRRAHKRKVRMLKREAAKKADAKIVKGMARLRIAERIAAGEDVPFDEDEDEEEEDRIWTTVLGNWSLPDEDDDDDDDDDVCGGAGGLGGSFGGGSGGTGGQGVNQLLLSGN